MGKITHIPNGPLLYEHAAQRGSIEGQYRLGYLLRETFQDLNQAEPWLRQAAQQEHVLAQRSLGVLCARLGNLDDAERWIGAAAQRGYGPAQENYRILFEREAPARPNIGSSSGTDRRPEP